MLHYPILYYDEVMHESVDDLYRPAIFARGVRQPFPAPTQPVKAPEWYSSSVFEMLVHV